MKPLKQQKRCLLVVALLIAFVFTSCTNGSPQQENTSDPLQIFTGVDFKTSPYKHLNNGGIEGDDPMPYNIDAITGATVTVEGPAVATSIPLSMRELENRNDGLVRGVYRDTRGDFVYEGLDLYYLLYNMVDGDNGILLTDKAHSVLLKDCNRKEIASFTVEEVQRAHADGRPILLAYGIGTKDEASISPFVFDAANEKEHSEGYVEALQNDDGCLKLVYDTGTYGENADYTEFVNVAYVYVREESEPGFKHTAAGGAFEASRYTDYIVSFRGQALGYSLDLTVRELEALVTYDNEGKLVEGGVGYADTYSLANNAYWYVNEYEGLDLYKLLIYLGMDDAEAMGIAAARTTLVSFVANDGVPSQESFSVDTLSYPDAFGFYNKNAADEGDGSYAPTNADLVDTGYPVLLAYGVNKYPYAIMKGDDGYLSGLSNSGGPIRVVFGKTQYNHANGSYQVQYLRDVIVGEDMLYQTHQYTDNTAQNALAGNTLQIAVNGEDGAPLINREMTVGEVEDLIYGADVAGNAKKAAQVKDHYEVPNADGYETDIYEGVNLEYFLMEVLGLPGTNGTITFSGSGGEQTFHLDSLFRSGYNTALNRDRISPVLAFAKNGSPLVESEASAGFVAEIELNPLIESETAHYAVNNAGGPLAVLIPSTNPTACDAQAVLNVERITVELVPDAYAHIKKPHSDYAKHAIRFYGEGLEREFVYTVQELESKQTKAKTLDYSVRNKAGELTEQRYRGIAVYELFTEIGIRSNAGEVTVHAEDGTSVTIPLSRLKKQSYENYAAPEKPALFAMLAYGTGTVDGDSMSGFPLVPQETDTGYHEEARNSGGPLKLILPQESEDEANASMLVKNVVGIEVSANEIDTWSHRMSDVYEEFLKYGFTFTVKNDDSEWSHVFTLDELEAMSDLIVRERYSVLEIGECEGLTLWKFIQKFAGSVEGIQDPIAINVYAADGYKNDLLSVFYKEGFTLGVADEDGNRKPLLLAYAVNGCPLVDSESHAGYTGLAGNTAGPLRVVAEGNQGASVKYVNKLVVTIAGAGEIVNETPALLDYMR
ncbi:hypothetical protein LJC07_04140 [Christensenellaceae bacterium OttesenSCG-928-L17]|nr:hypothetical protein [Christensenellaceae bacterium OttesenSCG-928-L17]